MENAKGRPHLRIPAKASVWYIASSALARSIGAAGTPIFTRLLSPEEYGLFPLYNTWVGIITVIVTLELTGGVIYRGLQKFSHKRDDFLSATFGLFLTIFIAFCTLYFAFEAYINKFTGLSTPVTSLMLLQIFSNTVIAFYTGRARFEYKYKSVAILNLLSSLGIPFLSILIIFLTRVRSEARIIGSSATAAIIGAAVLIGILSKSKKLFDKEIWSFLLKFNLPLIPHYLSMSMILRIGEITVGRYFGTEALGRYSVAMSVGMALTVITNGLLSALSPWMLRKIRANEIEKIRDFLLILTKGLAVLCLIILAFAPEAIRILTPPAFHSALPAVYALEVAVLPMFISNALVSGEMYYEKSGVSAIPSVISAIVSVLLSVLILPRVDYRFVSVFVLLSYVTLAVFNTLIFKRFSGENPLHTKSSLTVFLLTIGYALLLFLFRGIIMSRVILILPLLPALFTFAKQVYAKIKE